MRITLKHSYTIYNAQSSSNNQYIWKLKNILEMKIKKMRLFCEEYTIHCAQCTITSTQCLHLWKIKCHTGSSTSSKIQPSVSSFNFIWLFKVWRHYLWRCASWPDLYLFSKYNSNYNLCDESKSILTLHPVYCERYTVIYTIYIVHKLCANVSFISITTVVQFIFLILCV